MTRKLRIIIPLLVLVLAGVGFVLHTGFGSISSIGWSSISVLCPIGSLLTMISSKTMVPRAIISLVVAIVAIILLGRAFCAWICPVPIWKKWRTILKPKETEEQDSEDVAAAGKSSAAGKASADGKAAANAAASAASATSASNTSAKNHKTPKCACAPDEKPSNARTVILGGSLLSAAIFGFPVFCLICPVGLSFAMVFILIGLFGSGDLTWSVIVIPVLIILEVVVFRKWCSHICPISAFMSIVGKLNRTFRPTADTHKCVEKDGIKCGRCHRVCEVGIDPRHLERGAKMSECTKCRECVISCPAHAISMPFWPKKSEEGATDVPLTNTADDSFTMANTTVASNTNTNTSANAGADTSAKANANADTSASANTGTDTNVSTETSASANTDTNANTK